MKDFKNHSLPENKLKRSVQYKVGPALVGLTCMVSILGCSWVAGNWSRPASLTRGGNLKSSAFIGQTGSVGSLPVSLSGADHSTRARISEAYGKLPLSFEANHGQTDSEVKIMSRGNGYNLFLTSTEAVLTLRKADVQSSESTPAPETVLRMKLKASNPDARLERIGQLPGKSNYVIGNNPRKWRTNIATYARVKFHDVYPGVDLLYFGNQRQLEYDFVLAAGADPKAIVLGFEGAAKIEVDAQGDLLLHTGVGQVRQHRPVVYQDVDGKRQLISGSYLVNDNHQVSFQVGAYDGTKPLVIDPVLSYSTYLGGSFHDEAAGIALDPQGNAYVTGVTASPDFPTRNPLQGANVGLDAFVVKLNRTGSELFYATYFGGDDSDFGLDIASDPQGNAYITGVTFSSNFPTAGALQPLFGGGSDAFVVKFNRTGSELSYSTYLGGSVSEEGRSIAVSPGGNAYVTGATQSDDFPTTTHAYQQTFGGVEDAFVAKLNLRGSELVYSTYLGGSFTDRGFGIAVDQQGNAHVTGDTGSLDFPTINPFQPDLIGFSDDAFVTKLNPSGSELRYSTYLGGEMGERGLGIAVDKQGNAYVTGLTSSSDFPTTNPIQPDFGGVSDVFVSKLNRTGSELIYSTYLGGSDSELGLDIALDQRGSAYVVGFTLSPDFPTSNPLQPDFGGVIDAFLLKLNRTGTELAYSTYIGGDRVDRATGLSVDQQGNAYVTGETSSFGFPTTPRAFQKDSAGISFADAFIAKISD